MNDMNDLHDFAGMKVETLPLEDPRYPELLRRIFDPPSELRFIGDLSCFERPCIGIVGVRRATSYGETQAFKMAKDLSGQDVCVVSGLAYGIDAAAHKGALEGPGRTIAVLAHGLPEISPPRHMALAQRIVQSGGLLICEKKRGAHVHKSDYLVRNRLISGVSRGVVIVEAAHKSGALNTAKHALDQSRDLMAVPGRVTDPQSAGANRLIGNCAQLVSCAKDVVDCVGLTWHAVSGDHLAGMQKSVFDALAQRPMTGPELGEKFHGQLRELYEVLGELELHGYIRRNMDLSYAACGGCCDCNG